MADWLETHGVTLVVLAGYMHLLTSAFLDSFPDAVVNVHPSLLPEFPGAHAVEEQLAAGIAESGATVHLVDEGVDSGPILAQERVPVLVGDTPETLHARIKEIEHRLLPASRGGTVRALISTYDKTGLDVFARGLAELGWELVASGGTATYLEELGLDRRASRGADRVPGDARRAASRRSIRASTPASSRAATTRRTSRPWRSTGSSRSTSSASTSTRSSTWLRRRASRSPTRSR